MDAAAAAVDMKLEFEIDDIDFDDILEGYPSPADSTGLRSVCLIVEPDQHLQRLLHTWLIELQVEHTQLNDSEQAISACGDYKYSLIFMDLDSEFSSSVRTGVRNLPFMCRRHDHCTRMPIQRDLVYMAGHCRG
eukprot:m.220675 g.220675  ORF g.220675 m.220675 type:complete len:134 (-) comp25790_c0_seq3:47-448(-)